MKEQLRAPRARRTVKKPKAARRRQGRVNRGYNGGIKGIRIERRLVKTGKEFGVMRPFRMAAAPRRSGGAGAAALRADRFTVISRQ